MIQYFEPIRKTNINYNVLTLEPKDTLVVQFDQDIFDVDEVNQFCELLSKVFPANNILCTFKGIDIIQVIKNK